MGTSAGFVPAAVVECPYAPRMTRAAALALRAGAGLKENCVVVVTDGPTIGTAGNTSVTEIELQPTGPSEFGAGALVHTTFAPTAWVGVYDIDLGVAGTITELTDDWGNTAKDIDANAPTVQTQWPWHLGAALFRDNYAEDSTFIALDTAVGFFFGNRILQSTLNFTGKTAGNVTDNTFLNAGIVGGAGGGSFNIARSQITGPPAGAGTVIINHTGTGPLNWSDVVQKDGFIVAHTGITNLIVNDSILRNHGTAVADLSHNVLVGTSITSISDSELVSPGSANAVVINDGNVGTLSVIRTTLNGARVTKTAGSSGPVTINGCNMTDTTILVGAANGATTNSFTDCTLESGVFNLLGPIAAPGRNDYTQIISSSVVVVVAATATAGLGLQVGTYNSGTITQNRTAGTGSTTLFDCVLRGFSTFTDNGTTDPGVGVSINRISLVDSSVTLGNITGQTLSGTVLQQADLIGSTLTMVGPNGPSSTTSFLDKLRLHGTTLINAGFGCSNVIIEGTALTKTFTAYNQNRLANKSYDDIL